MMPESSTMTPNLTPFPDAPDAEAKAAHRFLINGQRACPVDGDADRWLVESASVEGYFYLVTFRPGRRCPCRASVPHCTHAAGAEFLRRRIAGFASTPGLAPAAPLPRPAGLRVYLLSRPGAPRAWLVQSVPGAETFYLVTGTPPACACGGDAARPCAHLRALPGTGPLTERLAARSGRGPHGERLVGVAVACEACGVTLTPGAAVKHLDDWLCPRCGADRLAASRADRPRKTLDEYREQGRKAHQDLFDA
ncbi:MAG TPA: hypothetical protein VFL91_10310 [Thermomicrobiales bacterium]|nr:hypothetical protein [Thermomicrobiales bacterium]